MTPKNSNHKIYHLNKILKNEYPNYLQSAFEKIVNKQILLLIARKN